MILCFGFIILISFQLGHSSVVFKNSGVGLYESEISSPNEKRLRDDSKVIEQPKLELIIDYKNLSQARMFNNHAKKNRRGERVRKRKEKNGKFGRQRNKAQKNLEIDNKNVLRNNEKDTLVRNRTIEILKNGVRILSTGETYPQGSNKTTIIKVNETLLEKILSSAVSKPDLLISASGIYKLPIGGGVYSSKKLSKSDIAEENYIRSSGPNKTEVAQLGDQQPEAILNVPENKKDKKMNETLSDSKDYEYEYESFDDFKDAWNNNDLNKSFEKPYGVNPDYESINLDYNIEATLEHIISVLKNLTDSKKNCSKFFNNCSENESTFMWDRIDIDEDPCQKWLECKGDLESAFLGENNHLPSCPCSYPSTIFYDDKIWDENQSRFFRWRDASSETERLDIYKPGAVYCIRSLLAQGSSSISSQHCCYDRELRLLTRGSGAGTVNFVSPDISKKLHDTVDILPWRLCKGDFTRYNLARHPDNGNDCPVNPNNEQYKLQVEYSKYF